MIPSSQNHENKKLHEAVHLRQKRSEQWRREGERPVWQNLSMIGALGWLIIVPTLLGVFVGRWLDGLFDTGIFFSGALIFLGISLGCYLAWHRINKE
jgi:ATP synthase protein I